MQVPAEQLLELFLQHVSPKGFKRIRYVGFWSGPRASQRIAAIRGQLTSDPVGQECDAPSPHEAARCPAATDSTDSKHPRRERTPNSVPVQCPPVLTAEAPIYSPSKCVIVTSAAGCGRTYGRCSLPGLARRRTLRNALPRGTPPPNPLLLSGVGCCASDAHRSDNAACSNSAPGNPLRPLATDPPSHPRCCLPPRHTTSPLLAKSPLTKLHDAASVTGG